MLYEEGHESGGTLFIKIEDTGIGIKTENLNKLFTAFNQVDADIF